MDESAVGPHRATEGDSSGRRGSRATESPGPSPVQLVFAARICAAQTCPRSIRGESPTSVVRFILLAGLATSAAAPLAKDQLLVVPAGARHFTISATAAKHGDVWSWRLPDGRVAHRMSMSLASENGIAALDGVPGSGPLKSVVVTATPIHTQQPDARTAMPGAEVSHGEGEISILSPEFFTWRRRPRS